MTRFALALALTLVTAVPAAYSIESRLHPIGHIEKTDDGVAIILVGRQRPAQLGINGASHALVFWWIDRRDASADQSALEVRPQGGRENPLAADGATETRRHRPAIAWAVCKVTRVTDNMLEIDNWDGFVGSPVIDIKPLLSNCDSTEDMLETGRPGFGW